MADADANNLVGVNNFSPTWTDYKNPAVQRRLFSRHVLRGYVWQDGSQKSLRLVHTPYEIVEKMWEPTKHAYIITDVADPKQIRIARTHDPYGGVLKPFIVDAATWLLHTAFFQQEGIQHHSKSLYIEQTFSADRTSMAASLEYLFGAQPDNLEYRAHTSVLCKLFIKYTTYMHAVRDSEYKDCEQKCMLLLLHHGTNINKNNDSEAKEKWSFFHHTPILLAGKKEDDKTTNTQTYPPLGAVVFDIPILHLLVHGMKCDVHELKTQEVQLILNFATAGTDTQTAGVASALQKLGDNDLANRFSVTYTRADVTTKLYDSDMTYFKNLIGCKWENPAKLEAIPVGSPDDQFERFTAWTLMYLTDGFPANPDWFEPQRKINTAADEEPLLHPTHTQLQTNPKHIYPWDRTKCGEIVNGVLQMAKTIAPALYSCFGAIAPEYKAFKNAVNDYKTNENEDLFTKFKGISIAQKLSCLYTRYTDGHTTDNQAVTDSDVVDNSHSLFRVSENWTPLSDFDQTFERFVCGQGQSAMRKMLTAYATQTFGSEYVTNDLALRLLLNPLLCVYMLQKMSKGTLKTGSLFTAVCELKKSAPITGLAPLLSFAAMTPGAAFNNLVDPVSKTAIYTDLAEDFAAAQTSNEPYVWNQSKVNSTHPEALNLALSHSGYLQFWEYDTPESQKAGIHQQSLKSESVGDGEELQTGDYAYDMKNKELCIMNYDKDPNTRNLSGNSTTVAQDSLVFIFRPPTFEKFKGKLADSQANSLGLAMGWKHGVTASELQNALLEQLPMTAKGEWQNKFTDVQASIEKHVLVNGNKWADFCENVSAESTHNTRQHTDTIAQYGDVVWWKGAAYVVRKLSAKYIVPANYSVTSCTDFMGATQTTELLCEFHVVNIVNSSEFWAYALKGTSTPTETRFTINSNVVTGSRGTTYMPVICKCTGDATTVTIKYTLQSIVGAESTTAVDIFSIAPYAKLIKTPDSPFSNALKYIGNCEDVEMVRKMSHYFNLSRPPTDVEYTEYNTAMQMHVENAPAIVLNSSRRFWLCKSRMLAVTDKSCIDVAQFVTWHKHMGCKVVTDTKNATKYVPGCYVLGDIVSFGHNQVGMLMRWPGAGTCDIAPYDTSRVAHYCIDAMKVVSRPRTMNPGRQYPPPDENSTTKPLKWTRRCLDFAQKMGTTLNSTDELFDELDVNYMFKIAELKTAKTPNEHACITRDLRHLDCVYATFNAALPTDADAPNRKHQALSLYGRACRALVETIPTADVHGTLLGMRCIDNSDNGTPVIEHPERCTGTDTVRERMWTVDAQLTGGNIRVVWAEMAKVLAKRRITERYEDVAAADTKPRQAPMLPVEYRPVHQPDIASANSDGETDIRFQRFLDAIVQQRKRYACTQLVYPTDDYEYTNGYCVIMDAAAAGDKFVVDYAGWDTSGHDTDASSEAIQQGSDAQSAEDEDTDGEAMQQGADTQHWEGNDSFLSNITAANDAMSFVQACKTMYTAETRTSSERLFVGLSMMADSRHLALCRNKNVCEWDVTALADKAREVGTAIATKAFSGGGDTWDPSKPPVVTQTPVYSTPWPEPYQNNMLLSGHRNPRGVKTGVEKCVAYTDWLRRHGNTVGYASLPVKKPSEAANATNVLVYIVYHSLKTTINTYLDQSNATETEHLVAATEKIVDGGDGASPNADAMAYMYSINPNVLFACLRVVLRTLGRVCANNTRELLNNDLARDLLNNIYGYRAGTNRTPLTEQPLLSKQEEDAVVAYMQKALKCTAAPPQPEA